ncbi:fluoride efflux transporter CrcB [Paenibacillus albiflavus]|uniref:fluoride efflux transporter CrcB n=1 Tax=Paenibacillus albiflavus TaxID=2545760 RepID=UPI001F33B478|nr:fluoride efflux transporter CrcB [Paenibacillus albiflavus]
MDNLLLTILLVGLGGFIGAITRYSISTMISKSFPSTLPYGTLTVNLLGSFALGILLGKEVSGELTFLIGTGFMGAFTTFSTFKLESLKFLYNGQINRLIIYQLLTYIAGIMLAFIGFSIVH